MLNIIGTRKIWFCLSGILVLASAASLLMWGLRPSIDFTGGSLLEVQFAEKRPANEEIKTKLAPLNLGEILVQPTEEKGVVMRFKYIDEPSHREILKLLGAGVEEKRFETVGPLIGKELKQKTWLAIIIAIFGIGFYILIAFRKVSRFVPSWKYGTLTIVTLLHDIIIPLGVFSILGHFRGVEVGVPFIAALLTILGYSVNNTIVVFDRTRENLFKSYKGFEEIVNESVNQSLMRSINTTITTLLALFAIYFLGGPTTEYFALALILGIATGAYSALCIANPLLVVLQKRSK